MSTANTAAIHPRSRFKGKGRQRRTLRVGKKIVNAANPRLLYRKAMNGHARASPELRGTDYLRRFTVSPRGVLKSHSLLLLRSASFTREGARHPTPACFKPSVLLPFMQPPLSAPASMRTILRYKNIKQSTHRFVIFCSTRPCEN